MDKEIKAAGIEIRASDVTDTGIFKGYASVFNVRDRVGDIVMPGAFEKALKSKFSEIVILNQHWASEPIGKPTAMVEDKKGLFAEGQLILDDPIAKRVHTLMKHGVLRSLSIGFCADPKKQRYEEEEGKTTRYLQEIDLWEFSVVTFPANVKAKITSVKSARSPRELEEVLIREASLSCEAAKFLAARHRFDGPCEGDPADGDGAGPCEVDLGVKALTELADSLRRMRATFA